jgi:hypothetical protein
MVSGDIPFQSVAILVVAIIGMISTLVAGYFGHQTESAAERARWVRDRRFDPYLALLEAYRKAAAHAEEAEAINRERTDVRERNQNVLDEFRALQAEADDPDRSTDAEKLSAAHTRLIERVGESQEQLKNLDQRAEDQEKNVRENVEELEKLFSPLRLMGSDRVKELAAQVEDEITEKLAASTQIEKRPDEPLFEKWASLFEAMRVDLGVDAPRRGFRWRRLLR